MAAPSLASPLAAGLLGDPEMAAWLSDQAEISAILRFETALAEAEGACGVIPSAAASTIVQGLEGFVADRAALEPAVARDGVPVPELVRQMRAAIGGPEAECLHLGATSQDAMDTGLMLRLGPILDIVDRRLAGIVARIDALSNSPGRAF